jgi:hypothetical protein
MYSDALSTKHKRNCICGNLWSIVVLKFDNLTEVLESIVTRTVYVFGQHYPVVLVNIWPPNPHKHNTPTPVSST